MKYALIGCGRIANNHIKAVLENKLELISVCDLKEENMELLLSKYNLNNDKSIKRYTDYKTMIKENKLDLIAIATDSGVHAEIALYCLKNNINLIIEKPIAMSIEDANKIVEEAEKRDLKVAACHQNRFNLAVQEMRKALELGRFGKISHGSIHVRWNRGNDYYDQAKWRGKWASDGGALMNQCIHGIDLLTWMLNDEIEEIYGQTRNRFHEYLEVEDIGMAIIKTKSGIIATVEGTTNVYPKNLEETLYLFGENGTVKLGGKSTNAIEVWDFKDNYEADNDLKKLYEETSNVYGNGHSRLYADMVEAINDNRQPYVSAKDGRKALEVILSIYKSQKTGKPVKWPLEDFASVDMDGEFK